MKNQGIGNRNVIAGVVANVIESVVANVIASEAWQSTYFKAF